MYFPLGGAISQVVTTKSDGMLSLTTHATGASGENMHLVQAGDVSITIVQNDVVDAPARKCTPCGAFFVIRVGNGAGKDKGLQGIFL